NNISLVFSHMLSAFAAFGSLVAFALLASAFRLGLFALLFTQHGTAAQTNLIRFDVEAFDHNLLAFLKLVANVSDAIFAHFRNMEQAFDSGQYFDEGAEFRQSRHCSEIGLAHFDFRSDLLNHLPGSLGRGVVGRGYAHKSRILYVDFASGLIDYAANHLAAGSNNVAYLIDWDLHSEDSRRVRAHLGARLGDRLKHSIENKETALFRLLKSFGHNLSVYAADLNIHLKSCYALAGARDFEIHIAVVIFGAGYIGENR